MKNKHKSLRVRPRVQLLCFGLAVLLIVIGGIFSSSEGASRVDSSFYREPNKRLKIQYLKPISLDISAQGINRLNFGDDRIIKIVGDSSQYSAAVSDNGSDLFLTSKLGSGQTIDLTLMNARSESLDLKLHVVSKNEGAIIEVKATEEHHTNNERLEIGQMIEAMRSGVASKYYVEQKKRKIETKGDPRQVLNQYVSYRYGDLVGAGFKYKISRKNKLKNKISLDEIKNLFKDVLAVSIEDGDNENLRIFTVFRADEVMDV